MKSKRVIGWASSELFFILSVVVSVLFALLSQSVEATLHLTQAQLGLLSGVFFICYSVGQLILGSFLGKISPRWILTGSALTSALGCLFFALANDITLALLGRGLLGFGLSSTFVGVIFLAGRDFPTNFSFMASLSQSLANLSGALVALGAAFFDLLGNFRGPFGILAGLIFATALFLAIFVKDSGDTKASNELTVPLPLGMALLVCGRSLQFWMALVFYSGLFGVVLAYADLWNIQFQLKFFANPMPSSAVINAMIPLGVTIGSLAAGAWARQRGNYVLPARSFGLLSMAAFGIMFLFPLPQEWAATMNFFIGFGLAGSVLGLAVLPAQLPKGSVALATSIVVTVAFIFGGIIQPYIGTVVDAPVSQADLFQSLFGESPSFDHYQRGILCLLITVTMATGSAFFFRNPNPDAESRHSS